MLKKILIITGAGALTLFGTLAFLKNSKMMKTRRAPAGRRELFSAYSKNL